MTWNPNTTVTINGVDYTQKTLNGVSINFGRNNVWEQARSSYASIEIINFNNIDEPFNLNQSVVIKVKDSANADVIIFTGKITDIQNAVVFSSSATKIAVQRITALGPFADMARTVISGNWSKEYDDDRINRIFTLAGVTVDTVDAGVYEFTSKTAPLNDSYTYAAYYATMGLGYIYETNDGKVGYANELRRSDDADVNGYFPIPSQAILTNGITSNLTLSNLANDISLEYKANAVVTDTDATSITQYGIRSLDLRTELELSTQASAQLERYLILRSIPRLNLSTFQVELGIGKLTNAQLDELLAMYMGKPIELSALPNAIYSGTYRGFVEGWNFTLNRFGASLGLITSEATLSLIPEIWANVTATIAWDDLSTTLTWNDLIEEYL
jgi:hypothetical protein